MEPLKKQLCEFIDNHQSGILNIAAEIWQNPEIGYNEHKTAEIVKNVFRELKLQYRENLAVTGCRAELDSGKPGSTIAVIGELDALYLPGHREADPETGAVHVCGHHLQIASMLGTAIGFTKTNVMAQLTGKIVFIAVPSEEFGIDEKRVRLKKAGEIRFFGGKQEMIRIGVFDDVDAAIMVHSSNSYNFAESYNCFIVKKLIFKGKAAHAGLRPEAGINALNAANIALHAINLQRETFVDTDAVRVHAIISHGGDAINIVPDNVEMEVQIRAKTIDAVKDAANKVDRSARAGATAVGGSVVIETIPGYMPLRNNHEMAKIFETNLKLLRPGASLPSTGHRGSSTDMGDLSCIMPVLHPNSCGIEGQMHACDFRVADPVAACVEPAKIMAMTVVDLLRHVPSSQYELMTKEQYLDNLESFESTKTFACRDQ